MSLNEMERFNIYSSTDEAIKNEEERMPRRKKLGNDFLIKKNIK